MIDTIKALAKKHHSETVNNRQTFHANPELSFEEVNTARLVFEKLTDLGLKPQYKAKTGVVALIEGEKGSSDRCVALRADLDALPIQEKSTATYASKVPGVMHACGHDVHTAALLTAARIIHELRHEFAGTVKLIFQPGEEKLPGGASLMIEEGVLTNPTPLSIIGQHVFPELEAGKVGFRSGKYMASCDEIYLKIIGKGGHAALPQNLVDPVLISAHLLLALQQVVSRNSNPTIPSVLSFGKVEANGATNVVPDEVKIEGTFRTFDEEWREDAHLAIKRIAKNTAEAMGGKCEVLIQKGYPHVFNDPIVTEQTREFAKEYLGSENVVDLDMRATGEDFSFYSQLVPGTFYRLGVRNEEKGIVHSVHTPRFDADDFALEIGSGLMAFLAIKQLNI